MKVTVTSSTGKKYELSTKKTAVTVGRSSNCDLVISDDALSQAHALIEHDQENYYITDLGSSEGVFLNGERIRANEKTPFNTFLQLSLGPLDCQVIDEEIDSPSSLSHSSLSRKAPRPVKRERLAQKTEKKLEASSVKMKFSLLLVLSVIAVLAYRIMTTEDLPEEGQRHQLVSQVNVPETLKTVPDRFLSVEEYKAIGEVASCEGQAQACEQLKLKAANSEGVVFRDNEYFIYLIPSSKESDANSGLSKFRQKENLLAIHGLLSTELFQDFQRKKFGQIHVILMRPDLKFNRVLRFHTKDFAKNGTERERLLTDLALAMTTGDIGPYLKSSKPLVHTKEL